MNSLCHADFSSRYPNSCIYSAHRNKLRSRTQNNNCKIDILQFMVLFKETGKSPAQMARDFCPRVRALPELVDLLCASQRVAHAHAKY